MIASTLFAGFSTAGVYKDEEVQHKGWSRSKRYDPNATYGEDYYYETQWSWVPSHGLPEIEDGKKVVFLYPCDCGCWSRESTERAMDLIGKSPNPERFVLKEYDPRYTISREGDCWRINDRNGAG